MEKLNKLLLQSDKLTCVNHVEEFDDYLLLKYTAKKVAFKVFFELKRKNLTQADLAKILDVSPQNISKILKGDDYKLSTLVRLEEALSINLIDRDVISMVQAVSKLIDVETFNIAMKRPMIASTDYYCINNKFEPSSQVLVAELYSSSYIYEESYTEI